MGAFSISPALSDSVLHAPRIFALKIDLPNTIDLVIFRSGIPVMPATQAFPTPHNLPQKTMEKGKSPICPFPS